jgi:hypothetical protein
MLADTMLRGPNCRLYIALGVERTLRIAVKHSGMSYRHALTNIKRWIENGLIMKSGMRYLYSEKGKRLQGLLIQVLLVLDDEL